jgi:hypothetical protein
VRRTDSRWVARSRPSTLPVPRTSGSRPAHRPQQRGLAGAVRAAEQHDLALVDLQRRTGERRELSEHGDRLIEFHDRHARHARSSSRRQLGAPRSRSDCPQVVSGSCRTAITSLAPGARAQVRSPATTSRLAVVGRRRRQDADRHRAVDVRLRRLSAVGHRHRDRPRAELAGERVRGAPRQHPAHHDGTAGRPDPDGRPTDSTVPRCRTRRPDTTAPDTTSRTPTAGRRRSNSRRSRKATRSPGSRCPASASTRSWSPASRRAT